MKRFDIEISTRAEDMQEGLFGQAVLYILGALPILNEFGIFPRWDIHAAHYAASPSGAIVPGIVELAYTPPREAAERVSLQEVSAFRPVALGSDWQALNRLWASYFKVPDHIVQEVEGFGELKDAVGVHYRGTDKLTANWDTNPVSHEQFIGIIKDYVSRRPEARRLFVASDDSRFAGRLRESVDLEVIDTGEVAFHKAEASTEQKVERTRRAMVDAVVLSRCQSVIITSSALSGFAKVLNPDLEIYRAAASKMFTDIPYFPVAYIPRLSSPSAEVQRTLDELMVDDWADRPDAPSFKVPFAYRSRFQGDIMDGLAMLNRFTTLIERSGLRPKSTVGRNDPCPCGSGKKFKQCHGR